MSLFDNSDYRWRETFFLFMHGSRRPTIAEIEAAFGEHSQQFQLEVLRDDEGRLGSVTVFAPDGFSAIDLCYVEGEDALEQIAMVKTEMTDSLGGPDELEKIERLDEFDAQLELLHFERLVQGAADEGDEDEFNAFFDPSALLTVIEILSELCDGVAVDPASATVI